MTAQLILWASFTVLGAGLSVYAALAAKGQLQNLPPTFNCGESTTPVIVGSK